MLFRRVFAFFAAAAALLQAGSAGADEPFRLIVTELEAPLVPNSVMHLAQSEGYFERAGVAVELVRVQQTPSAVAALRAGEGDMANLATEAVLRLVASGQMDLKAVVSPNKSIPFLIAAVEDIRTLKDLQGRSFGIGRPGSLDHSLSQEVMRKGGVDLGAIRFVGLGQPSVRAQALASGNIDATTMSIGTWLAMPSHDGLHVLVPQRDYFAAAPIVAKVNVVPDAVLAEKRDQVDAVVEALVAASRTYAADPGAWVDAMARARDDVSRTELEDLAQSFRKSWSVNGGLDRNELRKTRDFVFSGDAFTDLAPPAIDQWVSFGPVDRVLDKHGVASGSDRPGR